MTLEESKELATVEKVHKTVEVPVAEFEGEFIREMVGKIPQIVMEMPVGYARGTHLKLEVEVRVRSVTVDEFKSGPNKGELYREHTLALEEIKLIGAYAAEELDPGVGGSASAAAVQAEGEDDSDDRPETEEEDGNDVGF